MALAAIDIQAYRAIRYDGALDSARVAEGWARRGVKGVKAKIAYPTVWEDLEVIKAIRSAVGHETALRVDYNQSLTPREAVLRLRVPEGEGIVWVEEPTLAQDYEAHAHIARETPIPIQCGENWWGAPDLRQAIAARASDYVMLDVMKIGGVTGWLRAAALAETHSIRVSSHLWPELSARLLSVTGTAHGLEYADWWNPVPARPLGVEEGIVIPSEEAGCGIEWNEVGIAASLA